MGIPYDLLKKRFTYENTSMHQQRAGHDFKNNFY